MKRTIVVLIFCLISIGLIADEVTNPYRLPAKKKFHINVGYQYMTSHIKSDDSRGTVKMNYFRGVVYYGVTDKLAVYVKAGMSDYNTKATECEWEQFFGFGAKSIVLEKPIKLAVDFHISRMFTDGISKATDVESDIDWQEIQLSFASGYDIKPVSTFFGVKYRKVDGEIDPRFDYPAITYKQDNAFELFGGFDYPLTKKIILEVEGGGVGGSYISISSRYIF